VSSLFSVCSLLCFVLDAFSESVCVLFQCLSFDVFDVPYVLSYVITSFISFFAFVCFFDFDVFVCLLLSIDLYVSIQLFFLFQFILFLCLSYCVLFSCVFHMCCYCIVLFVFPMYKYNTK